MVHQFPNNQGTQPTSYINVLLIKYEAGFTYSIRPRTD
jgi:hypothetical protein